MGAVSLAICPYGAAVAGAEDVDHACAAPSSLYAETTTVSPSIATAWPNQSPAAASEAVSLATWPYVAPPSVVRRT